MSTALFIRSGLIVGLAASAAMAQDSETPATDPSTQALAPMVVVATRDEAPLGSIGSAVNVVGRDEIAARKKTSVIELLRTVPGVSVVQGGGPGKNASVFMRGAASSHTLVLIDGVRANAATLGSFDLSDLKTDNIERIEVLRGPQSTLYGSEAIGGVIHIITRKGGAGAKSSLRVEGGSDNLINTVLDLRGGDAAMDYSVSVSYEETDGVSAASEKAGNREEDGYENFSTASRVGFTVLEDGRADVLVRYLKTESDLDGFEFGIGPVDDPNFTQEREAWQSVVSLRKPLSDTFDQTVQIGVYDEELVGKDPDGGFNNSSIDNRNVSLELQSDVQVDEHATLSAGYAYEERRGVNEGSFSETADINALFLQLQWGNGDGIDGVLGGRYDDHSEFGDEVTYRATVSALCPNKVFRLHASVGTGFSAPTFNDLFFPGFGNPDLEAETSLGYDIGLGWKGDRAEADLTFFHNDFDDLIGFDATGAINVDEAEVDGVEASVRFALLSSWDVAVNYTLTDSEDKATGELLARRPKHRTSVYSTLALTDDLSATLSLLAVSDRRDSDGSDMDDYERVDSTITYDWSDSVQPYLRIENLFDEEYEEVAGFTTAGITAVGGVRVTW